MKKIKSISIFLCFLVVLFISINAHAEVDSTNKDVSYLCISEEATGFAMNKSTKEWKDSLFNNGRKYIIKKSNSKKYAYEVTRLGEELPFTYCGDFINAVELPRFCRHSLASTSS